MATDQSQQLKLINQALAAAKASIDLASQLLGELRGEASLPTLKKPEANFRPATSANLRETPGVIGSFDGEILLTETGQKYKVPENYASKTGLVYGDKLKMIDNPSSALPGAETPPAKIFKQIERVKRQRVEGLLSQVENGGWRLVTADASYRVLTAAVRYFGAQAGSEMHGLLPKDNKDVPFAALEGLVKAVGKTTTPAPSQNEVSQEKPKEKGTAVSQETPKKKLSGAKSVEPHGQSPWLLRTSSSGDTRRSDTPLRQGFEGLPAAPSSTGVANGSRRRRVKKESPKGKIKTATKKP